MAALGANEIMLSLVQNCNSFQNITKKFLKIKIFYYFRRL